MMNPQEKDLLANDPEYIPIVRPFVPTLDDIKGSLIDMLDSRMLTNSKYVQEFEKLLADLLEVENAVAVSNCTTGIILTLRALDLRGEILVPSFTFSATGHACFWAALKPVFVDCDIRDWTISLSDCQNALGPNTQAILAVHTFGNPADIKALEEFAKEHALSLVFDAAHALGSRYKGKLLGFGGKAEVFSLTPTKIITSGEGGIITTNDRSLAGELRILRNYGDSGDYNCRYVGLNARMAEFNAILGIATLGHADEEIRTRNNLARIYREELDVIPGISFQEIYQGNLSSYKDYTILIDEEKFGMSRNYLATHLQRKGISTRMYFYPPLHMQKAYQDKPFRQTQLRNTEYIAGRTITLPMHSSLNERDIKRICAAIKECHEEIPGLQTAGGLDQRFRYSSKGVEYGKRP